MHCFDEEIQGDYLVEMVRNRGLQKVSLVVVAYPTLGFDAFRGLLQQTSLKILEFLAVNLGENGTRALAEGLATSTLQELIVQGAYFGDNGAASIASALQTNTTLVHLDLVGNGISDRGAASLAEASPTCRGSLLGCPSSECSFSTAVFHIRCGVSVSRALGSQ